jgi:hypothetical protein
LPPRSWPVKSTSQGDEEAALYAVVRSFWADTARASLPVYVFPLTTPGGKPVMAVPGLTPRSPVRTVLPVLVTVLLPRTAKVVAVPSGGAADGRTPIVFAPTIKTASVAAYTNRRAARFTSHV